MTVNHAKEVTWHVSNSTDESKLKWREEQRQRYEKYGGKLAGLTNCAFFTIAW